MMDIGSQLLGMLLGLAVGSAGLVLIFRPWRHLPPGQWLVIEDWTRGKYPEHMGGVRVFRRCRTQSGAQSFASYLNAEFSRVAALDGRPHPNAEYRVVNEQDWHAPVP
jgi:hypothetical protein